MPTPGENQRSSSSFIDALLELERDDLERPTILVSGRERRLVLAESRAAFDGIALRCDMFVTEGHLVAVDVEGNQVRQRLLNRSAILGMLERGADWCKTDKEGLIQAGAAPTYVADDILEFVGPGLRPLKGLLQVPTYLPDGTLLQQVGYDARSQMYLALAPDLDVPEVPVDPDRYDVEAARLLIEDELLVDFHFETDADRANAIALIITGFVRLLYEGTSPLFAIDADRPGTGKTLLAKVISILLLGTESGVTAFPADEDQANKKVTAILTEGRPLQVFDNVSRVVDSGPLAAMATSEVWIDRRLQTSDVLRLPNRGAWVLTGNRIDMSREMRRRAVEILLAPRPGDEHRTYKHTELERWTKQNRGRLVWAVLTMIAKWRADGCPNGNQSLKSYVGWANVVGGILASIGIEGFLDNRDRHQVEFDEEAAAETEFFEEWSKRYGPKVVRAMELLELALQVELGCLAGKRTGRQQRTALGRYLSRVVEHPHLAPAGFVVTRRVDRTAKVAAYIVRKVAPDANAGADANESAPGRVVALPGDGERVPEKSRPVTSTTTRAPGRSGTSGRHSELRGARNGGSA